MQSPPPTPKRAMSAALLSMVVVPPTLLVGGLLWALLTAGADRELAWMSMGIWAWPVAGVTGAAVPMGLGLLLWRSNAPRLPAAAFLAVGMLPALAGAVGMSSGVKQVIDAVAHVNPLDKGTILANGFHETLVIRLFGGGLSVLLLTSFAAGLSVAAFLLSRGPRAEAADAPALQPAAPAAAAMLCLALALALISWVIPDSLRGDALSAVANVNPAERVMLLASTAAALGPGRMLSHAASVGALVLALGAGLLLRERSSPRRALAVVLCAVPVLGLYLLGDKLMLGAARAMSEPPWARAGDFQPMAVDGRADNLRDVQWLVTSTGLAAPAQASGTRVPLELAALTQALSAGMREQDSEDTLREELLHAAGQPSLMPLLVLAVDDRVDGAKLRLVVRAAEEAGVRALRLVGTLHAPDAATIADPLLAAFLSEVRASPSIPLFSALPPRPDEQPGPLPGWQGRLESSGPVNASAYPEGASAEVLTMEPGKAESDKDGAWWDGHEDPELEPLYLLVDERTSAAHLLSIVESAARRHTRPGLLPVLITEPLPKAPALGHAEP
ncbi:hypothetical protein P2318_33270 [Myxococcaceae bacterium GXIMD 01537]